MRMSCPGKHPIEATCSPRRNKHLGSKKEAAFLPPQQIYHIIAFSFLSTYFSPDDLFSPVCTVFAKLSYGKFHLENGNCLRYDIDTKR